MARVEYDRSMHLLTDSALAERIAKLERKLARYREEDKATCGGWVITIDNTVRRIANLKAEQRRRKEQPQKETPRGRRRYA